MRTVLNSIVARESAAGTVPVARYTVPAPDAAPAPRDWRVPAPQLRAVVVWGLIGFAALAALATLSWPLGHDQAIFALNGAVVAAGGQPYRDAFEIRGPLAFWTYALLRLAFGPTAWGVRVLDVTIMAGTAALLHRVLRPIAGRTTARVAAAVWPLVVVTLNHQDSAQFDLWIGAAALAGAALVAREGGYRQRDLAAFGLIVGLATLTKQVYPVLLAVAGAVILDRRRRRVALFARDLAVVVASAALPVAAAVAWFWAHGLLADMWEAHTRYALEVYSAYTGARSGTRLTTTLNFLLRAPIVPTALATAGAGLAVLRTTRRPLALAAAALLACELFIVELQGRFFLYHWAALYPVLTLLSAVSCADAVRRGARGVGVAVAGTLIAQSALWPGVQVARWLRYLSGGQDEYAYYSSFAVWQMSPADERAAARYVHRRTRPGDAIGMWAVNAAVPFLADRPLAGRFAERRFLNEGVDGPLLRRYRAEFVRDIATRRPRYFVVNLAHEGTERPLETAVPDLGALLARRYVRDTTFGPLALYRLRTLGDLPAFVR